MDLFEGTVYLLAFIAVFIVLNFLCEFVLRRLDPAMNDEQDLNWIELAIDASKRNEQKEEGEIQY